MEDQRVHWETVRLAVGAGSINVAEPEKHTFRTVKIELTTRKEIKSVQTGLKFSTFD